MFSRRNALKLGLAATILTGVPGLVSRSLAATPDPLQFDADSFTELTETITTGSGDHVVVYRFYKAITYVARPVDAQYQSLNISVPVSVDGRAIDASRAPVLFANSVGGYMPSSVAAATGVGGGSPTGVPPMGAEGKPPAGASPNGEVVSGGNAMISMGKLVSLGKYALAAGYVVVEPGARGRTLVDADGTYYGVAPAAIVDLKAAIRYLRHNAGRIPGDMDCIVSSGTSAGGALSALLGASGDSDLYASELAAIGAADASDAIFASGDWCPITDLERADAAYEWNWGSNPVANGTLDASVSAELKEAFAANQTALGLTTPEGASLTAELYPDYLLAHFLQPSATAYLAAQPEADRTTYLAANPWISWDGAAARFSWSDYLSHVGARKKSAPAFDAFDLSSGENNLFGVGKTAARHFTAYSLRHASGDANAVLDTDIPAKLAQMNPMGFIANKNSSRARHWWIRVGTKDSDTSLSVVGNLAAALVQAGDDVNAAMYWDAGHGANNDPDAFMAWIADIAAKRRA